MDRIFFGLSIEAINWVVLLFAAIILISFFTLLSLKKSAKKATTAAPVVNTPAPVAQLASHSDEVSPEVIAAITAAIAAVWQQDTGFVVRHVRRVQNAPAWNRAGREDQVYSRM